MQSWLDGDSGRKRGHNDVSDGEDPVDIQFRLLVPDIRVGSVIGRGGEVINRVRQQTGARVKMEDATAPGEDRVVAVSSPAPAPGTTWCAAADAVILVGDILVDAELASPASDAPGVILRVLVSPAHVGALIGRGGGAITRVRSDSGAHVRVMPADKGEAQVLHISGGVSEVKAALVGAISLLMRAQGAPVGTTTVGTATGHVRGGRGGGTLPSVVRHGGRSRGLPHGPSAPQTTLDGAGEDVPPTGEVIYRVLLPSHKAGAVIGRGGDAIRRLRDEIGAFARLDPVAPGGEDRLLTLSSLDDGDSGLCPAQAALMQAHALLVADVGPGEGAGGGAGAGVVETAATLTLSSMTDDAPGGGPLRLLVPPSQLGALIGKGGSTIAALRSETGATLKLTARDGASSRPGWLVSPAARPGDELLTISGDVAAVEAALLAVSHVLRASPPREAGLTASQHPVQPAGGRRGGGGGRVARDAAMTREALSPSTGGCVITVTVEVPVAHVGSIIGLGGANIAQVRSASGAKVKLHDSRGGGDGAQVRLVEISGTAHQAQVAQSLISGFLISGAQ